MYITTKHEDVHRDFINGDMNYVSVEYDEHKVITHSVIIPRILASRITIVFILETNFISRKGLISHGMQIVRDVINILPCSTSSFREVIT